MRVWMLVSAAIAILVGVLLALLGVHQFLATAIISLTFGILVGVFQNRRLAGPEGRRNRTSTWRKPDPGNRQGNHFWDSAVRAVSWICPGAFLFISARLIVASFETSGRYLLLGLGWAVAFAAVPFLTRLEGVFFGKAVSAGWKIAVSRYPWVDRTIPREGQPARPPLPSGSNGLPIDSIAWRRPS